jgi:quinol---cytochrome c reductase iron-sulfur subunit, bacillus type
MAKADIRPAEKTSRRSFLQVATGAIIGLIGLVLGIPFLAALIGSAARTKEREFNDVAALDALPVGQPVDLAFSENFADGFIQGETVRRVWLVRSSASEVSAFSPICPHLGCRFDWDAKTSEFKCPCHASAYTIDGRVVAGPAPRPLDTLPVEVRQGRVFVKWQQFKVGTAGKVPA